MYNTVKLNIQRVRLNGVEVNPTPWYITNTKFIGNNYNGNYSELKYDASRCGSQIESCLDLFRHSYSGATTPLFTVYVTATDGGGLVASYQYYIEVLNTPIEPQWVNMPATISIVEKTAGPSQIYPMVAVVPGYVAGENIVRYSIINIEPQVAFSGGPYFSLNNACNPPASTAVQCKGLWITNNVGTTTFDYLKQKQYNITIWLTNEVTDTGDVYTISSSVIINIEQLIYQPVLIPSVYTVYVKENVTDPACIYTITGYTHKNNHTSFRYTMANPTPLHFAFYNEDNGKRNQTGIVQF